MNGVCASIDRSIEWRSLSRRAAADVASRLASPHIVTSRRRHNQAMTRTTHHPTQLTCLLILLLGSVTSVGALTVEDIVRERFLDARRAHHQARVELLQQRDELRHDTTPSASAGRPRRRSTASTGQLTLQATPHATPADSRRKRTRPTSTIDLILILHCTCACHVMSSCTMSGSICEWVQVGRHVVGRPVTIRAGVWNPPECFEQPMMDLLRATHAQSWQQFIDHDAHQLESQAADTDEPTLQCRPLPEAVDSVRLRVARLLREVLVIGLYVLLPFWLISWICRFFLTRRRPAPTTVARRR
jgi:hypothetical protein